ncbi:MAG TPA: hypothetical protein VMU48_10280 [Terracidiphilus sp.]|nr:hypothetical protein [Terracidiphilus sp.]
MEKFVAAAFAILFVSAGAWSQDLNTKPLDALHWRFLGSFRGGRVTAVAGVPGDPNIYYFGTPGGGIWKTTDAGRVWTPIFDQVHVASIGALAIAPSDSKTLYAGTGEQTPGDGMYKSTDEGQTWTHDGLDNTRFIQAVLVDPHNPNILVAGANSVGMFVIAPPVVHSPTTLSTARGVFKTTDGGKTWKQTFSRDDSAGVFDMVADPSDPRILYASVLIPAHAEPKPDATGLEHDDNSEIYKSTDEGSSWTLMAAKGLPPTGRGRLGISVAAGTHGRRLYVIINQGFYRSDDGGETWYQSTKDPRIVGSSYFSRIFSDTKNPDILYAAQTSLYRSTDGGRTFTAFVGAPSGDDFHVLWIDPGNPSRLFLGVDQGAILSVDAGKTWSTWYNQPTGQFYHVTTDEAFPYRTYAAQQDSGTQSVPIRSEKGEITPSDVTSVGGFEFCFIAPDPLHPDWIYSGGWYGSVVRYDRKTGQTASVFEKGDKYRVAQMPPLFFSPHNPHALLLGTQFVLKTTDDGKTWTPISPDLTKVETTKTTQPEKTKERPPAIDALAESPLDAAEMWAATTNRQVQVTRDGGGHWQNVTPAGIDSAREIFYIEPSHFDPAEAFLSIGSSRQAAPAQVLRTRDYGATWQPIIDGLPPAESVRVVREDPVRKGLLFAGTASTMFLSFDDGGHWHPLTLNLPATPVTDIDIHGDDLVISTYGRGLWVLDDLAPLRQWTPDVLGSSVHLFQPVHATRVRWDTWQDTPLPIETPTVKNPPDGVMIDYWLKSGAGDPSITIRDAEGNIVRRYTGKMPEPNLPPANVPEYWFERTASVEGTTGLHRFVWDLRYDQPKALPASYYGPILQYTEYTLADHAIPHETPRQQPQGPLVAPGDYTVEFTADGQTQKQSLHVDLDPRVSASQADLEDQLATARSIVSGMNISFDIYHQLDSLAAALKKQQKQAKNPVPVQDDIEKQIKLIQDGTHDAPGLGPINRDLSRMLFSVEAGDERPTEPQVQAATTICSSLDKALGLWNAFNDKLRAQNPLDLPVSSPVPTPGCTH